MDSQILPTLNGKYMTSVCETESKQTMSTCVKDGRQEGQ